MEQWRRLKAIELYKLRVSSVKSHAVIEL